LLKKRRRLLSEEFAIGDSQIVYYKDEEDFIPEAGDIVLYDRVFENKEHDHIGIVIEKMVCSVFIPQLDFRGENAYPIIRAFLEAVSRNNQKDKMKYQYKAAQC